MHIKDEKSLSCEITASLSSNEYTQSRFGVWTVNLECAFSSIKLYATTEQWVVSSFVNIVMSLTLSVTLIPILPVNKELRNFQRTMTITKWSFIQKPDWEKI